MRISASDGGRSRQVLNSVINVRVFIQLAPFRREKRWTMRHAIVAILVRAARIDNHRAAESFGFHFFEIASDRFPGDIAIEPEPIDPGPNRGWRLLEIGKEVRGWLDR